MSISSSRANSIRALLITALLLMPGLSAAETLSRIAFGSCATEDEPQPIWEAVLAEKPDLWIWGGDNVYGDTDNMQVLEGKYQRLLQQPGYKQLLATKIPILATWDDHDFGANDGGADYAYRAASQETFLDFFGVAKDDPRRERAGVYHAEIRGEPGRRVQTIVLDTRYHRSPLRAYPRDEAAGDPRVYWPNPDPEATILGEAQWAWLQRQLLKPADLRLIVSSIQVLSSEHRFEKWMNFPREYRRLLDLLQETRAEGVILLSGDRHHAELSSINLPDFYPLYDLTSSGINKSRPRTGPSGSQSVEPNRYRIDRTYRGHHFGMVEIDWDQPDPMVRLSIVNQEGQRPIEHAFPLSSLSLRPRDSARLMASRNSTRLAPKDHYIRIDGDLGDWDGNQLISVDGEHLFLRFPALEETTLTRSPSAIHVLLDFDGDETGTDHFLEAGTDLEIIFSPQREPGERGWRPVINGFFPQPRALMASEMALAVGPTHAAQWFEIRLSRAQLANALPAAAPGGAAGLAVFSRHKTSGHLSLLAQESVTIPAIDAPSATRKVDANVPPRPAGGLRVVTFNTLWGSQIETPAPFGRVLQALDADIFLLQEWSRERISESQVTAWFSEHVDGDTDWSAMVSGTASSWSGTLLVSRYPLRGQVPRFIPVDAGGWDFPVRLAAAVIETPMGDVLAASVHLKASGAIHAPEDQRRFAEADAVNRILLGMKSVAHPEFVVLGGDFNLLGDPDVIDRATRMLDQDGSQLTRVEATLLGDSELLYTFGREQPRSRLDYLNFSDHSLRIANAFVLDTRILSSSSLRTLGLQSDDSAASDHLPVVMDIAP